MFNERHTPEPRPPNGARGATGTERTGQARRVTVVGCGHVGLVMAAGLAELGHHVTGLDIDVALVEALNDGRVPFVEPGLPDLVCTNTLRSRLRFTDSYDEALAGTEFVFLCVNTPATATGAADLRYVRAAVRRIGATLADATRLPIIVNKSTSPIGTAETIETILHRTFADAPARPAITANPEFLREGTAVHDFFNPERIVVGAQAAKDAERVATLYSGIDAPVIVTDLRTAEMIKYVSNAFLATRVSFINEIARLCEHLAVDVDDVVTGIALDPRIGRTFMTPGIGYGGSCLPKDVAALCHTGETMGMAMRVLSAVQEANLGQKKHAVNCIRRLLGRLEGVTIGVWGVTFKGGTEDQRESAAIDAIRLLRNEGAIVKVYDPSLPAGSPVEFADEVCGSALEVARDAACVALFSDWSEFKAIDLAAVRRVMAGRLLYDGRNLLARHAAEAADLLYHGVGRPPIWEPAPNDGARPMVVATARG